MQSLNLSFYQRVLLWNMVGNHAAPNLKEASVGLRIIEKIRLSDQEQIDTEFTTNGQQYGWKPVSPTYGDITVELETDEAKSLAAVIEAPQQPVLVRDAEWLEKMVKELTTASPNGAVS
jgi:hypothetical protein